MSSAILKQIMQTLQVDIHMLAFSGQDETFAQIDVDLNAKVPKFLAGSSGVLAGFNLSFAGAVTLKASAKCFEMFQLCLTSEDNTTDVDYVIPIFLSGDKCCTLASEVCVPAWAMREVSDHEAAMDAIIKKHTFHMDDSLFEMCGGEKEKPNLPKHFILTMPYLKIKDTCENKPGIELTRGPFSAESKKRGRSQPAAPAPIDLLLLLGSQALKTSIDATGAQDSQPSDGPPSKRRRIAGAVHLMR